MRPNAQSSVARITIPRKSEAAQDELPPAISPSASPSHSLNVICREILQPTTEIARPAPFLLRIVNGDCQIPLRGERVLIGRSECCDLQLADAAVSSRHCELRFDGSRWSITDLDSRNGTQVNGVAVKTRALYPGDELLLGNQQRLRFEQPGGANQNSPAARRRLKLLGLALLATLLTALLVRVFLQG
jgi:hypothetical protein